MLMQPFINILVSNASRGFFTPGQTSILNPGIRVSGSAARANKEYIIFPKLDVIAAGSTLLRADILWFEVRWIHSWTSFSH
jgi:hypothetical protein